MTDRPEIDTAVDERRHWMSVLARSAAVNVEDAWQAFSNRPAYRVLRGPETGLIMVRGRAGGDGQPFNFGEMTATRCVLRLESGETGFAFVAGRDTSHCEQAAAFDALLQHPEWKRRVQSDVITVLEQKLDNQRLARTTATAATKVDFFTLVRGDE